MAKLREGSTVGGKEIASKNYVNEGLSLKVSLAQSGEAEGYAPLDGNKKIPSEFLPAQAVSETYVVNSEAAQIGLDANQGDICVRTDISKNFIHNGGTSGTMSDWTELLTPAAPVQSVNSQTGNVYLEAADVGAVSVGTYSTDMASVVKTSGAQNIGGVKTFTDLVRLPALDPINNNDAARKKYVDDGLNLKAGLASANTFSSTNTFTGSVIVPTPSSNTHAATKKYVDDAIGGIDAGVVSVNSKVGAVTLNAADVGAVASTGNESVAGVKTFTSIPELPSTDPSTDNQAVRKKYVDEAVADVAFTIEVYDGDDYPTEVIIPINN